MQEYNRENKIFDDDEREIWQLTHLSLSFKSKFNDRSILEFCVTVARCFSADIVEIDNLVGIETLVKLQLDNNIITRIQGLESLTQLKWLDLSFNLIEEIEGIETLVNLEDLSLFQNRIKKLQNLDTLEKLNVLSVGNNQIDSLDESVKYLHCLRNNLEVLKICGNTFKETGEKEYKRRIIAYLRRLKYLDYQLIDAEERDKALDDYKTELEGQQLEAEDQKDTTESKEAYRLLEEAHIQGTQHFFLKCCEAFDDYEKISGFRKYFEVWQYSEGAIEEFITQFQATVKNKHRDKKRIIAFCKEKMHTAERNSEKESIAKIEAYLKEQKHTFRKLDRERQRLGESGQAVDYAPYQSHLQNLIVELKGDLLDIEMALQQSLEAARSGFVANVNTINSSIQEAQLNLSQEISTEFINFATKLKEELNRERENFVQKMEEDEQGALEEYGVPIGDDGQPVIELGSTIELLCDGENKDAVDEMVTQFQEKIDSEAGIKDAAMTKGW